MRKPMTQKPGKRATTRKPKRGKGTVAPQAPDDSGRPTDDPASERAVRGPEDPSLWCRSRFWWSRVRAHRCTPTGFNDLAGQLLEHLSKEDRERAKRALKRVDQEGTDPSTKRGDLGGMSFVSLVGAIPGYTHTLEVFHSAVWKLLGPTGLGPDALTGLQDTLGWQLVLGARYCRATDDPDSPASGEYVRMGRIPGKAAPVILGRLGSLQWRSLPEREFIEAVRLLAVRPSWPGLSMLCVLMLRMGDSDARVEISTVRLAIRSSVAGLCAGAEVDARAAAVFQHLVRRRILSALRTLEHPGPVLEWAQGQLVDLERACRTDNDRRWHARQVDALACALGNVAAPGVEWLGWLHGEDLHDEPAVQAVLKAIASDERALCLLGQRARGKERPRSRRVPASPKARQNVRAADSSLDQRLS